MLKCHLISILLAIYFLNFGDETFALKTIEQDQHPEICQAKNRITCKTNIDCNAHVKIVVTLPRHEKRKGVCEKVRNTWQKHCICRRDGCDHGDICRKNSDCGKDQWGRRGKCVSDYKWEYGKASFGNKMYDKSTFDTKKWGPWHKHKHCECLPPKYPKNCQGVKGATCTRNKDCGRYGSCARPGQFGSKERYCVCRRKTCGAGDLCFKDADCGYLEPSGTGRRGTCEAAGFSKKAFCKCPVSPGFDLEEAVDQNLEIAKENQMIVKTGKKWLKALYEALKEKYPRKYDNMDEDESDESDEIYNRNGHVNGEDRMSEESYEMSDENENHGNEDEHIDEYDDEEEEDENTIDS